MLAHPSVREAPGVTWSGTTGLLPGAEPPAPGWLAGVCQRQRARRVGLQMLQDHALPRTRSQPGFPRPARRSGKRKSERGEGRKRPTGGIGISRRKALTKGGLAWGNSALSKLWPRPDARARGRACASPPKGQGREAGRERARAPPPPAPGPIPGALAPRLPRPFPRGWAAGTAAGRGREPALNGPRARRGRAPVAGDRART